MNDSATSPLEPPARDRLIAAAAELFAEKSYGGVSVREICKKAGTGINMIHHYFGNKDGLLEAIANQFDEKVYAVPLRLLAAPAKSRDDLISRIELLFETTLEACLAQRNVMMVVIREQSQLSTLVAYQTAFVGFLEDAKSKGFIREGLESEMISGAMLDRIISQVQYAPWIKESTGYDIESDASYRQDWCRASVDLFLNGVLA
ncbi:MAG: TetR/AcrR family transcriptional regulator [Rhodobacteraceae bacterium]|nr:TetR/AcrR family transcriptional regulator [Paracoccaceae bacterium]